MQILYNLPSTLRNSAKHSNWSGHFIFLLCEVYFQGLRVEFAWLKVGYNVLVWPVQKIFNLIYQHSKRIFQPYNTTSVLWNLKTWFDSHSIPCCSNKDPNHTLSFQADCFSFFQLKEHSTNIINSHTVSNMGHSIGLIAERAQGGRPAKLWLLIHSVGDLPTSPRFPFQWPPTPLKKCVAPFPYKNWIDRSQEVRPGNSPGKPCEIGEKQLRALKQNALTSS